MRYKFHILLIILNAIIILKVYAIDTLNIGTLLRKDTVIAATQNISIKLRKSDSIVNNNEIILHRLYLSTFPVDPKKFPDVKKIDISGICYFPEEILEFKNLEILNIRFLRGDDISRCYNKESMKFEIITKIPLEDIVRELKFLKEIRFSNYVVSKCHKIPENIIELKNLETLLVDADFYPVSILQSKTLKIVFIGSNVSEPEKANLITIFPENPKDKKKMKIPRNGTFINYYDKEHKIVEGNFVNGRPDGKWTFWFYNGKVEQVRYYKNGLEDGEWVVWDDKGEILLEHTYVEGKLVYKKNIKILIK